MKKGKAKGYLIIANDRGLHTRPSTEVVKCASRYSSAITLTYQKWAVNARSLLGVLMLAATKGSRIAISAEGDDAEEAVQALVELSQKNFNVKY